MYNRKSDRPAFFRNSAQKSPSGGPRIYGLFPQELRVQWVNDALLPLLQQFHSRHWPGSWKRDSGKNKSGDNEVRMTCNNHDGSKLFKCLTLLVAIILGEQFLNLLLNQVWAASSAAQAWFRKRFKNHLFRIINTRRIVIIVDVCNTGLRFLITWWQIRVAIFFT